MAEPASTAGDSSLAIVASTDKISRDLRIGGYEALKALPTGASWSGPMFSVAHQYWHVAYCPNGDTEENEEFSSVFLVRVGGASVPVSACFSLSLLDIHREPVRAFTRTTGYLPFPAPGIRQGFPRFFRRSYLERSKNLRDDEFYFRFEVSVLVNVRSEDTTAPHLLLPPPAIPRLMGDMLRSGDGADVTFIVAGETFRAHRFMLAASSPVFRAGLWGPTMDGDPTNDIQIEDMIPEAFQILLKFLYTEQLPLLEPEEGAPMLQHLFVASDRYDIPHLKNLCEIVLSKNMSVRIAASTLVLAVQHNSHFLKNACFKFIEAPGTYEAVLKTPDFMYLASNFPELVVELMTRVGPRSR